MRWNVCLLRATAAWGPLRMTTCQMARSPSWRDVLERRRRGAARGARQPVRYPPRRAGVEPVGQAARAAGRAVGGPGLGPGAGGRGAPCAAARVSGPALPAQPPAGAVAALA